MVLRRVMLTDGATGVCLVDAVLQWDGGDVNLVNSNKFSSLIKLFFAMAKEINAGVVHRLVFEPQHYQSYFLRSSVGHAPLASGSGGGSRFTYRGSRGKSAPMEIRATSSSGSTIAGSLPMSGQQQQPGHPPLSRTISSPDGTYLNTTPAANGRTPAAATTNTTAATGAQSGPASSISMHSAQLSPLVVACSHDSEWNIISSVFYDDDVEFPIAKSVSTVVLNDFVTANGDQVPALKPKMKIIADGEDDLAIPALQQEIIGMFESFKSTIVRHTVQYMNPTASSPSTTA